MVSKLSLDVLLLKPLHWPEVRQLSFLLCFVLKVVESVRQKVQGKFSNISLERSKKRNKNSLQFILLPVHPWGS